MKKNIKRTSLLIAILFLVFIIFSIKVNADTSNARNLFDAEKLSDNTIAVLFAKGNEKNLYLGRYNPSNNNWVEVPVGDTAPVAKEAAMAIHNDKAHVAYITSEDKIAYLYQTDSGWSDIELIESNDANGERNSNTLSGVDIEIDSNGFAHIVYIDSDGAVDDYYKRDDGLYANNKSGSFLKTVVANCTGWFSSPDGERTEISKPIKISIDSEDNTFIAYKDSYWNKWMGGSDTSYAFEFISINNSSLSTNGGASIIETCSDGTSFYTLISESGKYIVLNGNIKITETEKSFTVKSADMTLDNSNLYYAAINGTDLLFYQNGTFVENKEVTTPILSSSKFVTTVINGTQYIIYTGNDVDNSLVISKLDNGEISEYLIPSIITWTVSFDLNGVTGTEPDPQTINDGGYVIPPTNPRASGWQFISWHKGPSCTDENIFEFEQEQITQDTILYAKWEEREKIKISASTQNIDFGGLLKGFSESDANSKAFTVTFTNDGTDFINYITFQLPYETCPVTVEYFDTSTPRDSGDSWNVVIKPNYASSLINTPGTYEGAITFIATDGTISGFNDENSYSLTVNCRIVVEAPEEYDLWIGNTRVDFLNKSNVLGDGKVSYNPTTNTLTLNGATITGGGNDEEGYGIKYLGNTDLNIVANGTNVVSDTGNRRNGSAGLLVGGTIGEYTPNYDLSNYHANVNITINEGASLTFNGGTTLSDYYPSSYGICLWQNDGNVAVTGKGNLGLNGGSSKYSYGIYIPDTLTLNTEGNVEVNTADDSYYAVGIQAGNIVINDGTVNINNANTENASVALSTDGASYNNDTRGNITINNGSVHVVGGTITDSSGKSYGVYSDKTINVNGGSLEASTVATTGTAMAVNITPTIPDGTNAAANTEPSIVGSVKYNPDNNSSYKYYKTPATIYTVTFETYGGGTVASQEIVSGEKATEPNETPSRDGYTFFGWCSDAEISTAFDFSQEITSNKTVYAGYKKEVWVDNTTDDSKATIIGEVTLTDLADNTETTTKLFDETIGTNYITPMSDEVISKINSAKSTCETYISNNGYTNKGTENNTEENRKWDHRIYPDAVESYSSEEKSILRTHIASGSYGKEMTYTTTVYAEYDSRPLYTVTFKDGDSTITTQEVREGEKASKPTDPTKDGYMFMGWYADSGFTTEFNFDDTTITDNTSIYAKYVKMIPVYRMYNPNSGEHLYTTDAYEVKIIFEQQGWGKEGIAWYTSEEGTPVYRLYNPRLGNHLYTSDTYEISVITRTQGWVLDFDGAPVMFAKGDIPVYRLFNPGLQGQHHLTTDLNEYRVIPKWGWQQEGIAMKVLNIGVPQTTYYFKNR